MKKTSTPNSQHFSPSWKTLLCMIQTRITNIGQTLKELTYVA